MMLSECRIAHGSSAYAAALGDNEPEGGHVPESDAKLIQSSWREPERFAEIYDAYFVDVHKYVERRLGRDVADDLAAETFLIAFRQREHYDLTRGNARPWLYGIATNLIGRHRRKETGLYRALARAGSDTAADTHEDRVAARVSAQQLQPEIVRALGRLSKGDRDVLLLMALADLSHDEIAQALDIPYGTVCSRLHRARRKLRQALPDIVTPTTEGQEQRHG
jgi:RNA polymerase sigma factor (sigma-70 family)